LSETSRRYYALAILTLAGALSYLDRNLIVLLLEPIRADLRLSDTQLGLLTGVAFGLFYATLGVPLSRWSDRGDRAAITALAVAVWSMTMAGCAWVGTFPQLLLTRVLAGAGEAGCIPATYSLIGDYFPRPAQRTGAMSVFWLASPVSALVAFVAGGWLNAHYGWRLTFAFMAVPGLAIALLVRFTVRETRAVVVLRSATMIGVFSELWRRPATRQLGIGIVLLYTLWLGLAPWYAAFMVRSHGVATQELGVWFGLIFAVAGVIGVATGGYVAKRWFAGNERGQLRACAVAIAVVFPLFVVFLTVPGKVPAFMAFALLMAVAYLIFGPTFALMQRLVPQGIRATSLAVVLLFANLIGMGVGPQCVGLLSDLLAPRLGRDSLRVAMMMVALLALWSGAHFWRAGKTVEAELFE